MLERVDVNTLASSRRTLFLDRTDLMNAYYEKTGDLALKMRVVASPLGKNVGYFVAPNKKSAAGPEIDAVGLVTLHGVDIADRWLCRNSTHLVKIIVPREAIAGVLTLKRSD